MLSFINIYLFLKQSKSKTCRMFLNGSHTQTTTLPEIKRMELFILFGGAYALYTVGAAIAAHIDYREVNK